MNTFIRRIAPPGIVAGVAVALAPNAGEAGIIRVPNDVSTVRVAVQNAAAGDTIRIVGNGGATYPESDIRIDKDLTFEGGWRVDFQVRDADTYVSVIRDVTDTFDRPIFRITAPVRVEFDGLWFWGGRHAILAENGSDLVLRDCVLRSQRNPVATGDLELNRGGGLRIVGGNLLIERGRITSIITAFSGAALAAINANSVILRDATIDNCIASRTAGDASGGAVYARGVADLRIEGGTLTSCATVQDGGLVYAQDSGVTISDAELLRGLASRNGGALFLVSSAATIDRCAFEENRGIKGGAIHATGGSSATIRDSRFFLNRASDQGGAYWTSGSTFDIQRTEFDTNYLAGFPSAVIANEGGAVYALASNGAVTDGKFLRERSRGKGGAWFQVGGETQILRTRFESCDAEIFGGALAIELGGRVTLDRCLLARNSAKFGGGISASFTGALNLVRCTVTEGTGRSAGGGVYVDTGGIVRLTDTVACRSLEGEVVYCAGGGVFADHALVWNDDATNIRAEWGGGCADPTGSNGNLKADPQFCGGDPDYRVAAGSPAAGSAGDGGDRGWLPAGCGSGTVGVDSWTWGRIKAGWRSR